MDEYIKRSALFEELKKRDFLPAIVRRALAVIPSEDVVPVVHGKWIESANFDSGFWVCSKCRFVSEAIAAHKLYGYCPNCGAKMDGGTVDG